MRRNQEVRLVLSTLYLLVGIAVVGLTRYPASGFLPSLFAGVPWIIWVSLILSFVGFSTVSIFSQGYNRVSSLIGSMITILVFISVPQIRTGLPYGRGDVLGQLGTLRQILDTGFFDPEYLNYPFTHLAVSKITMITGMNEGLIFTLYLISITLLLPVFTFVISRYVTDNRQYQILATLIAMIPLSDGYSSSLVPNGVALFLTLPALYIVYKAAISREWRWSVFISITSLGAIIVAHPLVGFIFGQVLASSILIIGVISLSQNEISPSKILIQGYGRLVLLFSTLYICWYFFQTVIWHSFFPRVAYFFMGVDRPVTRTARVGDRVSGLDTVELAELFVIRFGGRVIVAILTLLGIIIFIKYIYIKFNIHVVIPLALWMILNGLYLVGGLLAPQATFPPLRFVSMIYLTSPLFAAFTLLYFYENTSSQLPQVVATVVLFALIFGFGAVSLYDGQHTTGASGQQTHAEIEGSDWIIEHKEEEIAMLGYGGYRYEQSLLGSSVVRNDRRSEFPRAFDEHGVLPVRLTTEDGELVINVLEDQRYIRVTEADKIQGIQPRLTKSDEEQLRHHTDKIYTNGGYRLYT